MNIKYLRTGEKVNLVQKLNDGRYLIQDIFYTEYYDEMVGDCDAEIVKDSCRIVDHVYDVPPRSVFDDKIKQRKEIIATLERRDKKLRQAIADSEKEYQEMKEHFKKYEELKLLDDFLEGKITHYVNDSYVPEIIKIEDEPCRCSDRDMHLRLLSLFGNKKRKLHWNLAQYCDGSGGGHLTVIPCTSYEMAVSELKKLVMQKIKKERGINGRRFNYCLIDICLKYGFEVDADLMNQYEERKKSDRQNTINQLVRNKEKAQQELDRFMGDQE